MGKIENDLTNQNYRVVCVCVCVCYNHSNYVKVTRSEIRAIDEVCMTLVHSYTFHRVMFTCSTHMPWPDISRLDMSNREIK